MATSLDLKTFKDAIDEMKRTLSNKQPNKISSKIFDSAVATVNEICTRRMANNIEINFQVKCKIDELKENFQNYLQYCALSGGLKYRKECLEKVDTLDNLFTKFESLPKAKIRSPLLRRHTTYSKNYVPQNFRANRVSLYSEPQYANTKNKPDKVKLEDTEEGKQSKQTIQNTRTPVTKAESSTNLQENAERMNNNIFIQRVKSTLTEASDKNIYNQEQERLDVFEDAMALEAKLIRKLAKRAEESMAGTKAESSTNIGEIAECMNENVFLQDPTFTETGDKIIYDEFPIPIQGEPFITNKSFNRPKNYSKPTRSDEQENLEEFTNTIALEEKLTNENVAATKEESSPNTSYSEAGGKTIHSEYPVPIHDENLEPNNRNYNHSKPSSGDQEFQNTMALETELKLKTQEIDELTESNRKLKAANEELEKHQRRLIMEELSELKYKQKDMHDASSVANKDLRRQIEALENTIALLKSESQSLKTTVEAIMKNKDEEINKMKEYFAELLDPRQSRSDQLNQETNESGEKKLLTGDKVWVGEDY